MHSYLKKRRIIPVHIIISIGWIFCVSGYAKENIDPTKLADGVYVRIVSPDSNAVSNSGIIVLDHCVLIFDTHFTPEAGQALLDAVRSITSKPICYVINSHSHDDHTHGNQIFPDTQIIGSTDARREVMENDLPLLNRMMGTARAQVEKLHKEIDNKESDTSPTRQLREIKALEDNLQMMSRQKILPPFVTLDDSLIIQDGNQEIRVCFLGVGHTSGDVVLILPSLKLAFTGDLFFEAAIPNVKDAHILEWMKTLEEVLKMDADKFVPGHGNPGSKKEVAAFLAYFDDLKSMIQPAVDRGDSLEQVLHDMPLPAKYSSYRFQSFFPANVQKMYTELKELQLSTPPVGKSKENPAK
jgi:cyclase